MMPGGKFNNQLVISLRSPKLGCIIQRIDLFFGLYILANIDDKTYKISNKKADLVQ